MPTTISLTALNWKPIRQWWKHSYGRPELVAELAKMERVLCCSLVTKRSIFDFVSTKIRLSAKIQVFLFDDDYSYGVMQSSLHWDWFMARGATLKADPTYGPIVFDTFPWPQAPTPAQVRAVAVAARALHEYRRDAMRRSERLTLRDLYRTLEKPGKNPLRDLHTNLDDAVLAAYGFAPAGDPLAQLLALNAQVAARIASGDPVTAPGIPASYPDPADLVSPGCIQPPDWLDS